MSSPPEERTADKPPHGDCIPDQALAAFRAGSLSDAEGDRLCEHAARCPACEARLGEVPLPASCEAMFGVPLPALGHIRVETLIRENEELVLGFLGPPRPEFPHDLGTLGEYRVLELIGVGGSGVVLKGWDDGLGIPVTIKVLKDQADEAARDRFRLEGRTAGRFRDIPQVVRVLNARPDHDPPYFAMDYVPGKTLADLIGRLGFRDVARVVLDVATGLAEMHRDGWVHQDIKPANILVPDDSTPGKPWHKRILGPIVSHGGEVENGRGARILDLGLSFDSRGKAGKPRGCSPDYASPEQVRPKGDVSSASDVFSLGATLFHALTGAPPSARKETAIREALRGKRVPSPLAEVCVSCLRKDPARRPQVEEVKRRLARYLGRHRRRLRSVLMLGGLMILLWAGILWHRASSLAGKLAEIESGRHALQLRLDAERERRLLQVGQVGSLADESAALARHRGDPDITRLATQLRALVAAYEKDAGRPADLRTDIAIRTAKATAANAEGRFDDALGALPVAEVSRLTADVDLRTMAAYRANLERAVALDGRGQDEAAVESYRTAKRLDPTSFGAVPGLTSCLNRLGRKDEAVREWGAEIDRLTSLVRAEPESGPRAKRLALALLGRGSTSAETGPGGLESALGDAVRAIDLITTARKLGEEGLSDWLLFARAMEAALLIEKGDFRDGLGSAYALLNLEGWRSYSHPVVPLGMLELLIRTTGKVLDRLPADERGVATKILAFAAFQRGHLLLGLEDYARAREDAGRVLELEPGVPASILNEESRFHVKARAIRLRMLVEQARAKVLRGEDEEGARRHYALALTDADRVLAIVEEQLARHRVNGSDRTETGTRARPPSPADHPGGEPARADSGAPAAVRSGTGDGRANIEELLGETLSDRGEIHATQGRRDRAIADMNRAVDVLDRLVNQEGHADMSGVLASAVERRRRLVSGGRPLGDTGTPPCYNIREVYR